MISYDEAIESIYKNSIKLTFTNVNISDSLGMVCAEDITSPETVPAFNNSAMDGFAVCSSMLKNASESNPIILDVEGSVAAGDIENRDLQNKARKTAWEIMTGAVVPKVYDAVIKIEDIEILKESELKKLTEKKSDEKKLGAGQPQKILIKKPSFPKQNIRNAGEDFIVGDLVLKAGDIITPAHIMALASLGIGQIYVQKKPSIAVISTGKELVDDISATLKSGQIRNSNAPYILSELSAINIEAKYAGTIYDQPEIFEKTISDLLKTDCNIIISTGAVSMGRYDFIPDSLRKLGAEILFHKVAIRPGKPILFAKFPNNIADKNSDDSPHETGSPATYYFGLPGNPISAAVGLRFFSYQLIRFLQGLPKEKPLQAVLSSPQNKKSGFNFYRKAYMYHDKGQLNVDILDGQESFKIKPMLKANCWALLPSNVEEINAGEIVEIYPFNLEN